MRRVIAPVGSRDMRVSSANAGAPIAPATTSFRNRLAVIAVAASAIRAIYVLAVARHQPLIGDAETYHLLARAIAEGNGYVRPRELALGRIIPTAEFPPAYPLLLAMVTLLGFGSPTKHRLVGAVIGGVTVLLIGHIGRAIDGERLGLLAAGIAALYPQLIVFDGAINNESLAALLVAALVLAGLRSHRVVHFFAAGMLIGIALLVRTELLVVAAIAVVPVAWRHWSRRYAIVALAIGIGAIAGPWVIRNEVSLGHGVLFTNNSGTLIAGANCDAVYSGSQIGLWRLDCVPTPRGDDETVWSNEQRSVGTSYVAGNADRLPLVVAARVGRLWGVYRPAQQLRFESLEARPLRWLQFGWASYLVVAAFAIGGIVHRRRRRIALRPLIAPLVAATVIGALGYGNQRFRLPAEPALVLLAAAGAMTLFQRRVSSHR
jgi:4-amino-4-deoxy-L-arabinose transferase-like glycosyltransferase